MPRNDSHVFPAVFTYEDGFEISVTFPDLPGCTSGGANVAEALAMGKEALGGHLWCMEMDGDAIPEPSSLTELELNENERSLLIEVYMPAIRLAKETRSVNRTVTLPAWMNAAAIEKGINFSQALQETLLNDYGIRRDPVTRFESR